MLAVLTSLFVAMLQELKLFIVHNPAIMRVAHHANTSWSSINVLFFKLFFRVRASELVKQAHAQLRAQEQASTSSASPGQGTRLVTPSAQWGKRPMSWGTRPVPNMHSPAAEVLSENSRHPGTQHWQTIRGSSFSDSATASAQRVEPDYANEHACETGELAVSHGREAAAIAYSDALGEANAAEAALRGIVLAQKAEVRRQLAGEEMRRKEMQGDIVRNINMLLDAAAVPEAQEEESMGGCDLLLLEQEQEVCVRVRLCVCINTQVVLSYCF